MANIKSFKASKVRPRARRKGSKNLIGNRNILDTKQYENDEETKQFSVTAVNAIKNVSSAFVGVLGNVAPGLSVLAKGIDSLVNKSMGFLLPEADKQAQKDLMKVQTDVRDVNLDVYSGINKIQQYLGRLQKDTNKPLPEMFSSYKELVDSIGKLGGKLNTGKPLTKGELKEYNKKLSELVNMQDKLAKSQDKTVKLINGNLQTVIGERLDKIIDVQEIINRRTGLSTKQWTDKIAEKLESIPLADETIGMLGTAFAGPLFPIAKDLLGIRSNTDFLKKILGGIWKGIKFIGMLLSKPTKWIFNKLKENLYSPIKNKVLESQTYKKTKSFLLGDKALTDTFKRQGLFESIKQGSKRIFGKANTVSTLPVASNLPKEKKPSIINRAITKGKDFLLNKKIGATAGSTGMMDTLLGGGAISNIATAAKGALPFLSSVALPVAGIAAAGYDAYKGYQEGGLAKASTNMVLGDTTGLRKGESSRLVGAGKGALKYGALGSLFGPIGTAIGAVVGAGIGAYGDKIEDFFDAMMEGAFKWWDVAGDMIKTVGKELLEFATHPLDYTYRKVVVPAGEAVAKGVSKAKQKVESFFTKDIIPEGYGDVAIKSETGEVDRAKAAAKISNGKGDRGGKSYGMWQYASNKEVGGVQSFLKETGYEKKFVNEQGEKLQPGTPEFDKKWKDLANSKEFQEAQYQHGIKKYDPTPILKDLKAQGVNVDSPAIKEMALGASVQYGPSGAKQLFKESTTQAQAKGIDIKDSKAFIESATQYKIESAPQKFKSSSSDTVKSVQNRFAKEKGTFLAMAEAVPGPKTEAIKESTNTLATNLATTTANINKAEIDASVAKQTLAIKEMPQQSQAVKSDAVSTGVSGNNISQIPANPNDWGMLIAMIGM